jgi:hypothetical protein
MKEFLENRGRQDGTGPPDKYCGYFLAVGTQPHLSNIDIVAAILPTLQTFAGNRRGTSELVVAPRIYAGEGALYAP